MKILVPMIFFCMMSCNVWSQTATPTQCQQACTNTLGDCINECKSPSCQTTCNKTAAACTSKCY